MMSAVPLSILIITYNEEVNIRHALESVAPWAHEVFVVDSYSQDRTVEICREYGDSGVRVWRHPFGNYAAQRNWALEDLPWSNDWVFVLDADERVSPELRRELRDLFGAGEPAKDFYYVRRRFVFLGQWLRHAVPHSFGLIRLFRVAHGRYVRTVNEQVVVGGNGGYLQNDVIHEDHKGIAAWLAKHNRYSSMEAEEYVKVLDGVQEDALLYPGDMRPEVRTRKLKRLFVRMPFRPLLMFVYMYIWKRGFLDGKAGLVYCLLKAANQVHISAKLYEIRIKQRADAGVT